MYEVDIMDLLDKPLTLPPFSTEALQVCTALSQKLLTQCSRPDLVALGFWLREANIQRIHKNFVAKQTKHCLSTPRGLVFHLPPSNVEVMALYSWIPSLLMGNANILRWSNTTTLLLKRIVESVLPLIEQNTRFVSYDHDEQMTAQFSLQADMRVIWGGDETILAMRKLPLKPHAKELVFGDRTSLAAIDVQSYLNAPAAKKQQLSEQFYNDTYWFDQKACSSPRSIVWIGAEASQARQTFYEYLKRVIVQKKYVVPLAAQLEKLTHTYLAAMQAEKVDRLNNELIVVYNTTLPKEHCGYGVLHDLCVSDLEELLEHISRKEQTLSYFGIDSETLRSWAQRLRGRGIDRIVPIGQALQFDILWDGYNLLDEFSSKVFLTCS